MITDAAGQVTGCSNSSNAHWVDCNITSSVPRGFSLTPPTAPLFEEGGVALAASGRVSSSKYGYSES